ncbi:phage tail tape measure protein [Pseudomonas citronellolis]|uniref:phage tail tape measure protein n=1 Tax=Pseudomonas citronellolis TaxID=53408 RepID=UPI0022BA463E|nr:phage tail tape measure protein [Pseudomonas citronellolis]WBG63661.1 phage tail tape measure protein [Pseudomonas citronellolis]
MASRSLGQLTLDLIAKTGGFTGPLSKAERDAQQRMQNIRKNADAAGKAIGGFTVAAAGSLTALTLSTVKSAAEITRLSQVANANTTEFQKYALAAETMGVEQDKLADIFKDVNDKVGDFLNTGGGALKDFFDNVAPKVGVTADEFRKLSGPQALGLYVSSLEKAGASQQDMTFYLEAIASDATALLPLLKNNAAGFKTLADTASAAGAVLDNDTIKSANELNAAIWLIEKSSAGMKNQIEKALLPVLSNFAGKLSDTAINGTLSRSVSDDLAASFTTLAKGAVGAVAGVHMLYTGLKTLSDLDDASMKGSSYWEKFVPPARFYRTWQNFDEIEKVLTDAGVKFDGLANGYADLITSFNTPISNQPSNKVKEIAELMELLQKNGTNAGIVFDQNAANQALAAKQAADAINAQIEALKLQAATLGMTADQQTIYKLALDGATEAQISQAKAYLDTVAAFEKHAKEQEDYKSLVADLRTEEEKLNDQLKERLKIIDAMPDLSDSERHTQAARAVNAAFTKAPDFGGVDASVAGPAGELMKVDKAQEELEKWYEQQLEMLDKNREARADLNAEWDAKELDLKRQHEDALANIERNRQLVQISAAESTFGSLAEMAKSYAGESSGIYKAMFAVEKGIAIARAAVAIQEGIALAAANPFPLNLAAMATVAAETASIVGNIAAIGMAHDGIDAVPETGTWLLQKGERVTTASTSAKLDKTLDRVQAGTSGYSNIQVINNGEPMRARQEIDGNTMKIILDRVEDDFAGKMASGTGKYPKAVEAPYSLKRRGG